MTRLLTLQEWMILTLAVAIGIINPWKFLPFPLSSIVIALSSRRLSVKKILVLSLLNSTLQIVISIPDLIPYGHILVWLIPLFYANHLHSVFVVRKILRKWIM